MSDKSELSEIDSPTICAAALLFQRQTATTIENVVESCFIVFERGDDTYALRAKAERYCRNNPKIAEKIKNLNLVASRFTFSSIKPPETNEADE